MREYAYFPGCSLEKMAISYNLSALEATKMLGVKLKELEDWNCCGATAYFHVDEVLAYTMAARNLAMAEKDGLDLVAPCSGCYKNMFFTQRHLNHDPDLKEHINAALEEDNLRFTGNNTVHHLIDVFVKEIGLEKIKDTVKQPLSGLRVAPYYGCQILRPRKDHEEIENPNFFEELLASLGASPIDYALKMKCCGGSLVITSRPAAFSMVHNLLKNAVDNGADVIATACPLCQINLECYQQQINREFNTHFSVPVVYFTQLIGLALGIEPKLLGLGKEFISPKKAFETIKVAAHG
jgi:heterodisulfide reductase subunit B